MALLDKRGKFSDEKKILQNLDFSDVLVKDARSQSYLIKLFIKIGLRWVLVKAESVNY